MRKTLCGGKRGKNKERHAAGDSDAAASAQHLTRYQVTSFGR